MAISTVRPKVAQLTFQLFDRAVHPELFHVYKSHAIQRDKYRTQIQITADGHVVSWSAGKATVTEIAASVHQLVPQSRRVFCLPLREQGSDKLELPGGIQYRYDYGLERVPAEMFWMIQKQLGDASKNHELIQVFDSSGRMAIGGLSFIHLEARSKSLQIQAIHTFPDDLAMVKTQSTFSIA